MLYSRWLGGQLIIYPGNEGPGVEWFVSSVKGKATNNGKDWDNSVTTLEIAHNLASVNDTIWVASDHVETWAAAASALTMDTAGVAVRGVVRGRQMPTIDITHVDAGIVMSGAGCTLSGIRVTGGVDAIVASITISGTDCVLNNYEFRDVTGQATDSILTVDGSDRLLIDGYRHIGAAGAGGNSAIAIDGSDDIIVRNIDLYGNFAVGAVDFRTTLSARAKVHSGVIWNANASCIGIVDTVTGSTGFMGPDLQIMLLTNGANITEAITGATFQVMDPVYVCNLVNEKGMLINWTASTDA